MFLKHSIPVSAKQAPLSRLALASAATALAVALSACGGSANIKASTASGPELYMSLAMAGSVSSGTSAATLSTFSIDDTKNAFAQTTYGFSDTQSGAQVQNSGNIAAPALQRGLLTLDLAYQCGTRTTNGCTGVSYPTNPPQVGGWALELAGQAGGFAQILGSPFVPLLAANSCPSMTTAEPFQFVTLPQPLLSTGTALGEWNPQLETAYGSVNISASGTTVTLNSISQYVLTVNNTGQYVAAGGSPSSPLAASVTGACGSTVYGNLVSVPAQTTINNSGNEPVNEPATFGIGPSGLLVGNNGENASSATSSGATPSYQNDLGAGSGVIGLPKPTSAVDTTALVGKQFLGFYYGTGTLPSDTDWASAPVSFGFSSLPSNCASDVAPQTGTMIYGGDFTNNDPTASTTGYGNCDFAVDLGTEDAKNYGLYPNATVYVGSKFSANTTGATYNFPTVAIAGQLNGKYAIFLIGVDTAGSPKRAWGIYLLQSN